MGDERKVSMPHENAAAWLTGPAAALQVDAAPYVEPGPGELVVRNRAVAINPLDVIKQTTGNLMYRWLPYPAVLGEDVAGVVVAVGPGVTRFAAGDRVLGYAMGMEKDRRRAAEGGFQLFSVVLEHLAVPIPTTISYEAAAVLPLAVTTAGSALFLPNQLGLRLPTASTLSGPAVLVWGGTSSVGSSAVQLAAAAGYDVFTTASAQHHDRLFELGARRRFDYHDADVVDQIVAALGDQEVVGAFAAVPGGNEPALAVLAATRGARRLVLSGPSVSLLDYPYGGRPRRRALQLLTRIGASTASLQVRARLRGVRPGFVWGSALAGTEAGRALYQDFLPAALAEQRFVPAPEPTVVGEGLEAVQLALDRYRAGVAGTKLVVRL